ncbi:MAG: 30S ribosomal protein S12 methylthiotransferase RimO [Coriobacteriales bacterium]|jgi:ribosomal protein S12 methylthiotransferase
MPTSQAPCALVKNVHIVTLGCAKNEVDSDRMRALIEASPAFNIVDDAQEADAIIVNTCSFLVAAVQEGIDLTLEMVGLKLDDGADVPVIMSGCIPSRYGEQLVKEMPEVTAFVPVDQEDSIVDVLARVTGITSLDAFGAPSPSVLRTVRSAAAYVKISDGCDRFCSFCAIPFIRGRYYSRPADVILDEVRSLVAGGVREIVLIGQDTGIWGSDLEQGVDLAWLLCQVAAVVEPVHGWVRVLYLQPEGMTDDLIATIRDVDQVVPYIDLPLQHCDADVLRRMNRTGDSAQFAQLIDRLRREIPGMTIRTTAMAGFPGETDDEFEELCSFLERVGFDYTSVFSYSQEEGTAAGEMPDQVDEDLKLERTQRLHDIADAYGFASAARRVGKTYRVLIDGSESDDEGNRELIGRAAFQAPDSDGVIHLGQVEGTVGEFVDVRIDEAVCYELFGTIVSREPFTGNLEEADA